MRHRGGSPSTGAIERVELRGTPSGAYYVVKGATGTARIDARSGEAVKAFVVKKDPNVTAEDIIKFCGTQLTNYKVPKQIEFRTSLPKTNVGKILRRELRDEKKAAA